MEIICKTCGNSYEKHSGPFNYSECACMLSQTDVLLIHITEQQARLDTCRAQVEALMAEKGELKAEKAQLISQLVEGSALIIELREMADKLIEMVRYG